MRRSASALAAISRRTAPNGRKKDAIGKGELEEGANSDRTLPFARINLAASGNLIY
jgi:hypothetical protein